jgi:hypothetical protein
MKRAYKKPIFVFRDKLASVAATAIPVSPSINQASNSATSENVTTT